jgi:hypothetical protein
VVFWPLDVIELVDCSPENKFARFWYGEDIHHSSILKLAIESAIQKSTNVILSGKSVQDDSNNGKKSGCWDCVFTQKRHTVDILPYSQLRCFLY